MTNHKSIAILFALLACAPSLLAADGTWLTLAPMPDPRQEVAVAAVGRRIYAVGGLPRTNRVQQYDPQTNTWRIVAPLPVAVDHAAAVDLGGKLYVMGGNTDNGDSSALFEYEPGTDRWTRRAAMPTARNALAAAVIGGKIYAVGGASQTQRDLEVYDPSADAWTRLAPMPTGRNHLAAGAMRGKLYVVGGRNNANFTQSVLEMFDPATGTWSTGAPMPTGRSGHGGAVLNDRFYVFGGEGNPRSPLGVFAENEVYDPATDKWTALAPMPTPRHGIGAAAVDNRIYVPAGATQEGGGTHTGVNEAFVVQSEKMAFAHFVTGPGIDSEILLTGAGNTESAIAVLEFKDQLGQILPVEVDPVGNATLVSRSAGDVVVQIPAGGTAVVRVRHPGQPLGSVLRTGWILTSSEASLTGLLFLGRNAPGLSAARPLGRFSFPVRSDSPTALGCAIAFANPGESSAALVLILRDANGSELSQAQLSVPTGGQVVDLLERTFPGAALGAAFTGTVAVQSSIPVAPLALLFRGDTVTVLPITGE